MSPATSCVSFDPLATSRDWFMDDECLVLQWSMWLRVPVSRWEKVMRGCWERHRPCLCQRNNQNPYWLTVWMKNISVWPGVQWSVETAPDLHCLLLWSSYWIIHHRSTLRQVLKIPMEENRCWILLLIFQVTALTNIFFCLFVCFNDFSL